MHDEDRKSATVPEPGYSRLRRNVVLAASLVAIAPLVIITAVSSVQYERVYRAEAFGPIGRQTTYGTQSLEFFLEERLAALRFVVASQPLPALTDEQHLQKVFGDLSRAFGGFVDLGVIDSGGSQRSYVGPYDLRGKLYLDQDWFHEVRLRGIHVSDVFLGYRHFPHFVIAVKHEGRQGDWYILRATIDSEELARRIREISLRHPASDAFLVNQAGRLQTPSRQYGAVLDTLPFPVPPFSQDTEVLESRGSNGRPLLLGYSYVEHSPFIFILTGNPEALLANLRSTQRELIGFAAASALLILAVVWLSATVLVRRVRVADERRAAVMHKAEYTQRMATIGRLAAGVAHEVNNPLAIIGENAGLIEDIVGAGNGFPHRERILKAMDSISHSVERASRVTHRLLGFARHIEVEHEHISLHDMIGEVLGFLEKEAHHRQVAVTVQSADDLPLIESDRGQLEQVFLNLVNNALAAVPDRTGRITVVLRRSGPDRVAVEVTDNGSGIAPENLDLIFEPFFTTKAGYGTGLGLSITYGIIKKLGGDIAVTSDPGRETRFVVELPLEAPAP
ncbi:MAG: ATP-binding protein [Candidatus Krumholzibacteriia bacterium]